MFYREGDKIKPLRTGLVSMNIPPDSRPVAIRGKRLNPAQRTVLIEYVKRLSDLGVVKRIHNTEGWLNQMLFVKKGDGSLRPCLDLRATINSLSRPLVSSLPHAQDCVDSLGGSKYITIQDAKSAYWQLELHASPTEIAIPLPVSPTEIALPRHVSPTEIALARKHQRKQKKVNLSRRKFQNSSI